MSGLVLDYIIRKRYFHIGNTVHNLKIIINRLKCFGIYQRK